MRQARFISSVAVKQMAHQSLLVFFECSQAPVDVPNVAGVRRFSRAHDGDREPEPDEEPDAARVACVNVGQEGNRKEQYAADQEADGQCDGEARDARPPAPDHALPVRLQIGQVTRHLLIPREEALLTKKDGLSGGFFDEGAPSLIPLDGSATSTPPSMLRRRYRMPIVPASEAVS